MSRVSPSSHEPVDKTPRLAMTPARRARVLAKHGDVCSYPECAVTTGLEIDHVIALFLGGKDTEDNCAPLCYDHHKQKTARDARLAAKIRRLNIKQLPKEQQPKAQPIRSRGFQSRWDNP